MFEKLIQAEAFVRTNYKKLWKKLIDRDMSKTELRQAAGISSSSLAKLGKGEIVTSAVYSKICSVLHCEMGDILPANVLDYVKDRKQTISHTVRTRTVRC